MTDVNKVAESIPARTSGRIQRPPPKLRLGPTPTKVPEKRKATAPERREVSNQPVDSQTETPSFALEDLSEAHAEFEKKMDNILQRTLVQHQEAIKEVTQKFEQSMISQVTSLVEENTSKKVRKMLAPVLEENRGMQERIKQLEERLESS